MWMAYTLNQINFNLSRKRFQVYLRYNKRVFKNVNLFFRNAIIQNFFFYNTKKFKYIRVHLNFFKKNVFFKNIKLISKYNHFFFISVRQLKLITSYIGISLLIIETVKGAINNQLALKKNIGGKIKCIFF